MTDEAPDAGFVNVELLKFPVKQPWNPDLGPYLNDYIPRMVRSAHTTRKAVLASLKAPDHEYRFQDGEDWNHPHKGVRLVSHEFGDWTIFTIWTNDEYAYHATVQVLNGMAMEEAAFTIYRRWLETRPRTGGEFGIGKSRRFKWSR
jgi:hypothetical protein